jgi:hypothetical protein
VKLKLLVFLLIGELLSAQVRTDYSETLLSGAIDLIDSKWELLNDVYLKKETQSEIIYLGDFKKACYYGSNEQSENFRDRVMTIKKVYSDKKKKLFFEACSEIRRNFYISVSSDIDLPKEPRKLLGQLRTVQLRKAENFRYIEIGTFDRVKEFSLSIRKKANTTLISYQFASNASFEIQIIKKADYIEHIYSDISSCGEFSMLWGLGKSCFGSHGNQIRFIQKNNGGLEYYEFGKQISRAQFELKFNQRILSRVQYTLQPFFQAYLDAYPATPVVENNSGETDFVKDLRKAYNRLLLGDQNLTKVLLRQLLDKVDENKVKVTEF